MCQKLFSTSAFLIVAVLALSISGVAQTPNNVEKATRFQSVSEASTLNSVTTDDINTASQVNIRTFENGSSAQLEAIGSRYAWANSNSQLSELGSRYAWANSNSQLSELGSRYAWAH